MTGFLKDVSATGQAAGLDAASSRRIVRKPILPPVTPGMTGRRVPMAGMVLGYLGLVAILSMAPYWHLAGAPHQSEIMACTDFGGSR